MGSVNDHDTAKDRSKGIANQLMTIVFPSDW